MTNSTNDFQVDVPLLKVEVPKDSLPEASHPPASDDSSKKEGSPATPTADSSGDSNGKSQAEIINKSFKGMAD